MAKSDVKEGAFLQEFCRCVQICSSKLTRGLPEGLFSYEGHFPATARAEPMQCNFVDSRATQLKKSDGSRDPCLSKRANTSSVGGAHKVFGWVYRSVLHLGVLAA